MTPGLRWGIRVWLNRRAITVWVPAPCCPRTPPASAVDGETPIRTDRTVTVGVDEAGYAPKLGPLVVTATSLERPAASADLYRALSPTVAAYRESREPEGARPGRPILVADSKVVYRPGGGLAELERGVLAFLAVAGATGLPGEASVTDLKLVRAVSRPPADLDGLSWYGGAPEPLPAEADARDIELAAEALAHALSEARCGRPVIRSRVITACELNGAIRRGPNKAEFLVEVVAELVRSACLIPEVSPDASDVRRFSVVVDRLGGRKYYAGLLAQAFPGVDVREESLSQTESCYTVGSKCRVIFACRAESRCMTVALSSMVGKYVRELMMRRLNRFFTERLPGLRPTAGYPVDAARFLNDTLEFRRRSGVRDGLFIRAR